MKKLIALLMVTLILLSLTACGSKPTSSEKTDAAAKDNEEDAALQVDEGLLTVDITLPASFFEEETAEEIQAKAKEDGMLACTVHDDGSVTYKMTKLQHREMLAELKASLEEAIDDLLNGDEKVASFVSIDYDDDFTKFDIYVDPALYSDWDSLYVLTFYIAGAYYQAFSGVAMDEIDIVITFINNETKEVMNSASYQEYLKNQETS